MLITDKVLLKNYYTNTRKWQGIPGVEITNGGRIFACFYSGGETEQKGNYCVLIKSEDNAKTFSEPIAVINAGQEARAYDPCLWISPNKELWFFYSVAPLQKTYAVICKNPDANELEFSSPIEIGEEVMMNKPTVLSSGEWLFPLSVWGVGLQPIYIELDERKVDRKAFCYSSTDGGKTITKIGGVDVLDKCFDEHMFLELSSGKVAVYTRTKYGIGVSYSSDKGKTWSQAKNSGIFGPNSRFFIRRLKSGNILLVNHQKQDGLAPNTRKNLTAYISTDDGKTWQGGLLLDEREKVSYPDGVQTDDGYITVIYDRDRTGDGEILLAKFTEEDILKGKIVSNGYLKRTVNKLEHKNMDVIKSIENEKLIVILRGVEKEKLIPLTQAMYDGGVRLLEITYSANGKVSDEETAEYIKMVAEHFKGKMYIGAGTVLTEKQVELTYNSGGKFIISPDTFVDVIKKTKELNMVSIPGALTPTEIQAANRAGADFIKLFPITNLGVSYVKNVKAPLSHVKLLAVGGVNENNMLDYLKAGVSGFGLSSNIVDKKLLAENNYEKITELAKKYVEILNKN